MTSSSTPAIAFSRISLSVARAVAAIGADELILDGEVAWDGNSSYHVFDILWLNGKKDPELPLEERRDLLKN